MTPPRPPADDIERDTHLRAALRHAPDHDLAPPGRLTEHILHQARQAVAARASDAAPAIRPAGPLARLWRALAVPRPVWAGGLAALVVASLTLRLWMDEELPPAVAPVPTAVREQASPPPPVQADVPAAAPAPAATAAAPAMPQPGAPPAAAAPAAVPSLGPPREVRGAAAAAAARTSAPAAPAARPKPKAAPAPRSEPALDMPPAPVAATAADVEARQPESRAARAAAPEAVADRAPVAEAAVAARLAGTAMKREARPSPLRSLLAPAVAAYAAAAWEWQGPGMPARGPVDASALARLGRIEHAALGLWQPEAAAPLPNAPAMQWWQAGQPQGTLWLEPDRLVFVDGAGRRWAAALPPALIASLLAP